MISIQNLSICLGEFHLQDINMDIEKGSFFTLMGPTGAGKTVLLEAIAGLVPIHKGNIILGGKNVTRLPPEKRGVGIVYQDYALFPHLSVLANITYGLHYRKMKRKDAQERLEQLIDELNLSHLLKRLPTNLSGGENQRVALARALIVDPKVLLLDEPLSALDPSFREEIRKGLQRLHAQSDTTFLMVTHDFAEALSLSDRAAIMNRGKIEQIGCMKDIFQKPNSTFVADFVGMKNLFAAQFKDTRATVDSLEIELARRPSKDHGYIAIRPEDIVLSKEPFSSSMRNAFRGVITGVLDQGLYYEIDLMVNDILFKSMITKSSLFELDIRDGSDIYLYFKSAAIHSF